MRTKPSSPVRARSRSRDHALDIIRGICVITMTFAHLSSDSLPTHLLHLPLWVDGASGFVLLAGLVLGMIQHRRLARWGLRGAEVALVRRALLLYVLQVTTVFLALALGSVATADAPWLPDPAGQGGALEAAGRALTLRLNPESVDILSLYVVLFIVAMVALPLLARGHRAVLVLLSLFLYVIALAFPAATTLPAGAGEAGFFNWGAWQLLFVSGFLVGWEWRARGLSARLSTWRSAAGGVLAGGALLVVGVPVVYLGAVPWLRPGMEAFFDKGAAGPGWILMAWAAFLVAYPVVTRLVAVLGVRRWTFVEIIGRRSLDFFVILTVSSIVITAALGRVLSGGLGIACAVGALVLMACWGGARDWRAAARPRSPVPMAPDGSSAAG